MVKLNCNACKQDFQIPNSEYKRTKDKNKNFYCSRKCFQQFHLKKQEVCCSSCEKIFLKKHSEILKSLNHFCSRSCSISFSNKKRLGSNHPNWKDTPNQYREKALRNYEQKCFFCNYNIVEVLQVHHIDHNRSNNKLDNLVLLCPTCHVEVHKGLKHIKGVLAETD